MYNTIFSKININFYYLINYHSARVLKQIFWQVFQRPWRTVPGACVDACPLNSCVMIGSDSHLEESLLWWNLEEIGQCADLKDYGPQRVSWGEVCSRLRPSVIAWSAPTQGEAEKSLARAPLGLGHCCVQRVWVMWSKEIGWHTQHAAEW